MADPPKHPPAEQVLPVALARHWQDLPLPARVALSCGLGPEAVVGDLARPITPQDEVARVSLKFFVRKLVSSRQNDTVGVRVFPNHVKPDLAKLQSIWPKVRWSQILRSGTLHNLESLSAITYRDLLGMPGLGAQSVLEIGLRAETLASPWGETVDAPPGPCNAAAIAALKQLAAADWAEQVSGADRRFAPLIPDTGDSLAALARLLLASHAATGRTQVRDRAGNELPGPVSVTGWVQRVTAEVIRLQSLTLEDSLGELFDAYTGLRGRQREALLARLGWSGQPLTLAQAGEILQVTRQRVLQLDNQVRAHLPTRPVYLPALTRALTALSQAAPIEAQRAAELLRERGITATAFPPEGVLAASADLHIDPPIRLSEAGKVRVVIGAGMGGEVAAILVSARRMAGYAGIGHAEDVAREVEASTASSCTVEDVKEALAASPRFQVLCEEWYWATDLPARRNSVVRVCRDILSVAAPLEVTCLWEGLERWYTFRNLRSHSELTPRLPPVEVLRAFLRSHPDFRLDGEDRAHPVRPIDYRQQLQAPERIMVEVLRSTPEGVLDRATIMRECKRRGINPQTVSVELTYNYLFQHMAANTWGIRGTHLEPARTVRKPPPPDSRSPRRRAGRPRISRKLRASGSS